MSTENGVIQPHSTEETIFEAARHLGDPGKQAAYLDLACGGDEQLRQRIERLLRAGIKARTFFQNNNPAARPNAAEPVDQVGSAIGRYKLLQQIGLGGCGVVYMAEQEEPVRRRVALKIIKLGMDTKSVIARFEAERQALALMDHPNIAKVHDAGATETGRPYFVMELVRGVKITDYCDEKNLSTGKRLDLFIQVCQAVQHAHQKGIIHRDIKPSNILVTVNDGVAVPKVIDFGIAKATTDVRLTDKTVFTAFEQFIGTPAYMSPEQAEITSIDVDTRSDIYSLGVLLYELLTGKTPFDAGELVQAGLEEMRRTIREKEPQPPSTRVSTLGGDELTTTAKRRGLDAPKLVHVLRGDLDWIVMKCLEKDRGRRYETANGLATDIQRHLNNEPVVARPPSNLYRFQKMVRRNRLAFAAVVGIAAALVIGFAIALWQSIEKTRAYNRAVAAEKIAQTEAAKSWQIAQFLTEVLQGADPATAKGRDTAILWDILDKAAKRVSEDLHEQPAVEAELLTVIGRVYSMFYKSESAAPMYRRAAEIWKNRGDVLRTISSLTDLALALGLKHEKDKQAEGAAAFREALRLKETLPSTEHFEIVNLLHWMGQAMCEERRFAEAEAMHREALAIRGKLPAFRTPMGKFQLAEAQSIRMKLPESEYPDAAALLADIGDDLAPRGKYADAESAYKKALAQAGEKPVTELPSCPRIMLGLVGVLSRQDKSTEAKQVCQELIAVVSRDVGLQSHDVEEMNKTARLLATSSHAELRDGLAAVRFAERAAEVTERKDPAILDTLAASYAEAGDFAKAIVVEKEAIALNQDEAMKPVFTSRFKLYQSNTALRDSQ
jgi:eukaryotic-like serine/threonine-protein kinase